MMIVVVSSPKSSWIFVACTLLAFISTAGASPIPVASKQLVVGISKRWSSKIVELRRYERSSDGDAWRQVGASWTATIGRRGFAWGNGLHDLGTPKGQTGPHKREGDRKAAAGVFRIGDAYGYAKQASTKLNYTQVNTNWRCVNDSRSSYYNRVLDQRTVAKDWRSAELMRRSDHLYHWVIAIDHNHLRSSDDSTQPIPNHGSCIFFHIWRSPKHPTIGCTAMAENKLVKLLQWLDPAALPIYVALPRRVYVTNQITWKLPVW